MLTFIQFHLISFTGHLWSSITIDRCKLPYADQVFSTNEVYKKKVEDQTFLIDDNMGFWARNIAINNVSKIRKQCTDMFKTIKDTKNFKWENSFTLGNSWTVRSNIVREN